MERLEHATILHGAFAFIINNSISISQYPFPTPSLNQSFSIDISLSFPIIPISIFFYRYTNTNIFSYSHIHLYSYISIPIFHFSNFLSSFPPYLPCIPCIIKLYKICITEYFSFEYRYTARDKNRLKRRLGAESGYISTHRQFKYICLCIVDNIDVGKMYKTTIYILCIIPYCNRLRDMLFYTRKEDNRDPLWRGKCPCTLKIEYISSWLYLWPLVIVKYWRL